MPQLIIHAFQTFPKEASIIGRLLAGYTMLEIDLMNCVSMVRDDLDATLKTMFRARGETPRIKIADALGRHYYHRSGLGQHFECAIGAMRHCLKIRNQYSHCIFWDDTSSKLAFANLEEIAEQNEIIADLKGLTTLYVDVPLLEKQEAYFVYAEALLVWINHEGRRRAGKPANPPRPAPKQIAQPPLHIP